MLRSRRSRVGVFACVCARVRQSQAWLRFALDALAFVIVCVGRALRYIGRSVCIGWPPHRFGVASYQWQAFALRASERFGVLHRGGCEHSPAYRLKGQQGLLPKPISGTLCESGVSRCGACVCVLARLYSVRWWPGLPGHHPLPRCCRPWSYCCPPWIQGRIAGYLGSAWRVLVWHSLPIDLLGRTRGALLIVRCLRQGQPQGEILSDFIGAIARLGPCADLVVNLACRHRDRRYLFGRLMLLGNTSVDGAMPPV